MFVMPPEAINAIRNSPSWQDSVIFITYDEHGGSYDHVRSPTLAREASAIPTASSHFSIFKVCIYCYDEQKAMRRPT
jgi:phospholipase C